MALSNEYSMEERLALDEVDGALELRLEELIARLVHWRADMVLAIDAVIASLLTDAMRAADADRSRIRILSENLHKQMAELQDLQQRLDELKASERPPEQSSSNARMSARTCQLEPSLNVKPRKPLPALPPSTRKLPPTPTNRQCPAQSYKSERSPRDAELREPTALPAANEVCAREVTVNVHRKITYREREMLESSKVFARQADTCRQKLVELARKPAPAWIVKPFFLQMHLKALHTLVETARDTGKFLGTLRDCTKIQELPLHELRIFEKIPCPRSLRFLNCVAEENRFYWFEEQTQLVYCQDIEFSSLQRFCLVPDTDAACGVFRIGERPLLYLMAFAFRASNTLRLALFCKETRETSTKRRLERTLVQVAVSGSTESAAGGKRCDLAKLGNGRMLFAGQDFTHVHELLSQSSGTSGEEAHLLTAPLKVPRVGGKIASLVALPDQSVSVNAPGTLRTTLKETGAEADRSARSDPSSMKGGGGALFMQDIAIAFTDGALVIMSYVCDSSVEKEAQRSSVLVPKRVFAADTEGVPTHFWPRMLLFDWRAGLLLALSKTQTSHTIECFRHNATQNQSGQFRYNGTLSEGDEDTDAFGLLAGAPQLFRMENSHGLVYSLEYAMNYQLDWNLL